VVQRSISQVALLVRDYDEAIRFFTEALRFVLPEDTSIAGGRVFMFLDTEDFDRDYEHMKSQ
jgi:catechol 2,3-dioxygenase-like lactoylglutathione lyase family enzyme